MEVTYDTVSMIPHAFYTDENGKPGCTGCDKESYDEYIKRIKDMKAKSAGTGIRTMRPPLPQENKE